jgi:hypothetical protein
MTDKCKRCFNKCFLKECACGCGCIITDRDNNSRLRRFKHGHPVRPFAIYREKTHYNWKGGIKYDMAGYRLVRIGIRKYRPEHVLIVEKALGRTLSKGEVVHHKNGIKDDNHLENLELTTFANHLEMHRRQGMLNKHYKRMRSQEYQKKVIRDSMGRFVHLSQQ